MKQTMMERKLAEWGNPEVLARVTGLDSRKKGSNIRREMDKLVEKGIVKNIDELAALSGAHLRMGTEGWQWSIVREADCKRVY